MSLRSGSPHPHGSLKVLKRHCCYASCLYLSFSNLLLPFSLSLTHTHTLSFAFILVYATSILHVALQIFFFFYFKKILKQILLTFLKGVHLRSGTVAVWVLDQGCSLLFHDPFERMILQITGNNQEGKNMQRKKETGIIQRQEEQNKT